MYVIQVTHINYSCLKHHSVWGSGQGYKSTSSEKLEWFERVGSQAERTQGLQTPKNAVRRDSWWGLTSVFLGRKRGGRRRGQIHAGFLLGYSQTSNAAGWIMELMIFWGNYFMDSAVYDT